MNRANLFATSLTAWKSLLAMMFSWIVISRFDYRWDFSRSILILQMKIKMIMAILQLREGHLYEDIRFRHIGLGKEIYIWDTTVGLVYKTIAYLFVRLINVFLQCSFPKLI